MKRNWLPLIITLFLTIIILISIFIFLIFLPRTKPAEQSNAMMTIIPASTSTPVIGLTIVPTPTEDLNQQSNNAYKFSIGEYVQIAGTSGEGLSLRSGPSRTFSINFVGLDSEVFKIVDGPVEADGYVWWYMEAPYDKNRNGWSVDEYLQIVTVP